MSPSFQSNVNYENTRESVARVANSYHDKNSRQDKTLVFKFGKYIYIIDISINLDLPARGTDRQIRERDGHAVFFPANFCLTVCSFCIIFSNCNPFGAHFASCLYSVLRPGCIIFVSLSYYGLQHSSSHVHLTTSNAQHSRNHCQ